MANTNNLNITPVSQAQSSKEVTINDADLALENAFTRKLAVDLSGGNVTLTTTQYTRYVYFSCSGQTADRDLVIPLTIVGSNAAQRFFFVYNASATYNVTVKGSSGTTVVVAPGSIAVVHSDGTNCVALSVYSANPFDIAAFVPGVMSNSQLLCRYIFARAASLPINLTGSYASGTVAATGSTTITIKKNGSSIGTIVISAAGTTGAFTFSSAVSFAAGDILTLEGPATADATFANFSVNLKGTRT